MSMLTDSSVEERDARPSEVVPPPLFQNRIYLGAAIMTSSRKARSIWLTLATDEAETDVIKIWEKLIKSWFWDITNVPDNWHY